MEKPVLTFRQITAIWFWLAVACAAIAVSAASCRGGVSEAFLDRVAREESSNNPSAIGRRGEIGLFQLRPCAVSDVNAVYGWTCDFRTAATMHARAYARAYMHILQHGGAKSEQQVLSAYRVGPTRWKQQKRARARYVGPHTARINSQGLGLRLDLPRSFNRKDAGVRILACQFESDRGCQLFHAIEGATLRSSLTRVGRAANASDLERGFNFLSKRPRQAVSAKAQGNDARPQTELAFGSGAINRGEGNNFSNQ